MVEEHCCCEHTQSREDVSEQQAEDTCCKLNTELSLKEPDLEKAQLALVQAPPAVELPEAAAVIFIVAIWHDALISLPSQASWNEPSFFASSGTKTYLSTQRLRI